MKITSILLGVIVMLSACNSEQKETDFSGDVKLVTLLDSASYFLGTYYGEEIQAKAKINDVSDHAFLAGLNATLPEGGKSMWSNEVAQGVIGRFMDDVMKEEKARLDSINGPAKEEALAWLAEIAQQDGVKELVPGLYYKVIKEGTGPVPTMADMVDVIYKGQLKDGKVFDENMDASKPTNFSPSGVIPGWTKALTTMPEGSRWILYISPDLGYGPQGSGPIPPNSALQFDMELLKVKPAAK